MVGPISDEERRFATRQLMVGFVLLVAVSAGLIALQGGATLVEVGIVTAIGVVVGVVLLWILGVGWQ